MTAPQLTVQLDLTQLREILDGLAALVEAPGECDQPCCSALRREFALAIRSGSQDLQETRYVKDALPAAVEASDADTDTPHRFESER